MLHTLTGFQRRFLKNKNEETTELFRRKSLTGSKLPAVTSADRCQGPSASHQASTPRTLPEPNKYFLYHTPDTPRHKTSLAEEKN